jgi:hypothetical protein
MLGNAGRTRKSSMNSAKRLGAEDF